MRTCLARLLRRLADRLDGGPTVVGRVLGVQVLTMEKRAHMVRSIREIFAAHGDWAS